MQFFHSDKPSQDIFNSSLSHRRSGTLHKADFSPALSLQPVAADQQSAHRKEIPDSSGEKALHWTPANSQCSAEG